MLWHVGHGSITCGRQSNPVYATAWAGLGGSVSAEYSKSHAQQSQNGCIYLVAVRPREEIHYHSTSLLRQEPCVSMGDLNFCWISSYFALVNLHYLAVAVNIHWLSQYLSRPALFKLFSCYGTLIHCEFGCGAHTVWNRKPTFHKPCENLLFTKFAV